MPPPNEIPADYKISGVIRFPSAKGIKTAEIHCDSVKFMEKSLQAMDWYDSGLELLKMAQRQSL